MNDRERLLFYYAAGRLFLPRPRYLCFNSTLRCDGRCVHCGIWKDKSGPERGEIGAAELGRILDQPFFHRIETAWITGGEPTLREDIPEVAKALTGRLPSLSTLGIATNGLAPARVLGRARGMIEAAGPSRSVFFHVSLDGAGDTHDLARNRQGAFKAVMETVAGLKKLQSAKSGARVEIGLNCVISPVNVAGLDALHELARDLGVPITFNLALVTDQVYRNAEAEKDLVPSDKQRLEVIEFLDRIAPVSPAPFQYQYNIIQAILRGRPRPRRCLTMFSTININADATLILCPAASDWFPEDVTGKDLTRIWNGPAARETRRRVIRELCPSCPLSCSLGDSMPFSEWVRGWEG